MSRINCFLLFLILAFFYTNGAILLLAFMSVVTSCRFEHLNLLEYFVPMKKNCAGFIRESTVHTINSSNSIRSNATHNAITLAVFIWFAKISLFVISLSLFLYFSDDPEWLGSIFFCFFVFLNNYFGPWIDVPFRCFLVHWLLTSSIYFSVVEFWMNQYVWYQTWSTKKPHFPFIYYYWHDELIANELKPCNKSTDYYYEYDWWTQTHQSLIWYFCS